MRLLAQALGMVALLPAMVGPAPGADAQPVVLTLCSGRIIAIDLGGSLPPDRATQPCCAKGCHSRDRRCKIDRGQ